jgi:antirestriction protein ArdC
MKNKVYQIIVDRILEAIEKGAVPPWVKPWHSRHTLPTNLISKKPYRGFNAMFLYMVSQGFESNYYLTYKQAVGLGGKVRKGEKGFPVVFWSFLEDKDEDGNPVLDSKGQPKKHVLTRYYTVFNTDQCEGLEDKVPKPEARPAVDTIKEAEEIVLRYRVNNERLKIRTGSEAFYNPALDIITVPSINDFEKAVNYYATLFHEMGHSTGHKDRLARKGVTNIDGFGTEQYGKEELIAELTASFLCGEAGFEEQIEKSSTSYIKGWIEKIKESPELLVESAQAAQKAADYVLREEEA